MNSKEKKTSCIVHGQHVQCHILKRFLWYRLVGYRANDRDDDGVFLYNTKRVKWIPSWRVFEVGDEK